MNENLDKIILEAMGLEVKVVSIDSTVARQDLLDRLEWMRQDLARRYLLGAMKYLDNWMMKSLRDEDVISALDAKDILMSSLNLNTPGFELFLQDIADESA